MSSLSLLKQSLRMKPLAAGQPVPPLSLTADEGTWIRLTDFQGHLNVLLLFFRDAGREDDARMLREHARLMEAFERAETVIFGVTTARTDKSRQTRAALELPFFLLYDPLAIESRRFGCSRRIRPFTRTGYTLVGKDGRVLLSGHGAPDPGALLAALGAGAGPATAGAASAGAWQVREIASDEALHRLGKDKRFKLVDVRTRSEFEADHASGAVHLPVDELPARYRELGQTSHLLFVCQTGDRSAQAAAFLASIGGTELYVVSAGMSGWSGERRSLTSA